ncbi:isoflavone reductase-like protein [Rhizoctonia solani 123E]|uniref:Isoflavone reductase-like protein n=1 Tax=Rhizoctonia solani 123E TaxID=1423351 RepID=A0A074RPG9_9AGAM|nr:isoflavone reductase-like protein [Rhizoctonia solani 123E]
MSAKVVALAGANGYVGKAFANAFLDLNAFQVRLLVRAESIDTEVYQEYKKRGATLHAISYDDDDGLVEALDGTDVLVSAVGAAGLVSAQIPLVKASKRAGVKVFFPSEYGGKFPDTPSPLSAKSDVVKAAREQGLPVATLSNGGFPEYMIIPPLGFSLAEKKVTIWGEGNTKVTWTTVRSVADWLANVLASVPTSELQDKELLIQGNVYTLNELTKLWEQKHNDKLQVEHRPLKEIEDRLAANPKDFMAILTHALDAGYIHFDRNDNALYPGWKPDTVESIL